MEKSALLLFLSEYKETSQKKFLYENLEFYGEQTNDAPLNYILNKYPITKIICIVSKEVFEDKKDNLHGKTMFERYKKMVKEKDKKIEVIPIFYAFLLENGNEKLATQKQAVSIYEQIAKELDEEYDIYVDFTGGMRDAVFLMTTIIRYLEFRGSRCKEIIYGKLGNSKNGNINYICNINYIYNLFQMINGVSEFITTGNVNQLILAFEETTDKEENKEIRNLLSSLQDFSQTISLCDLSRLDEVLENLQESLKEFEISKNDTIQSAMLRSMVPEIKKRMYMESEELLSYPNLILWCVENRLLQQALTLYTEKMPVFYREKDFYPPEIIQMGERKEVNLLYKDFFKYLYQGREKYLIDGLKNEIRVMKERIGEKNKNKLKLWEKEIKKQINKDNPIFIQEAWETLLKILEYYKGNKKDDLWPEKLSNWKWNNQKPPGEFIGCVNETIKDVNKLFGSDCKKITENEKIQGLKNLSNRDLFTEIEECKYKKILSYYLAIKEIRNHVNHASGLTENQDSEEKEFREILLWLKDSNIIEINFSYDKEEIVVSFDNIMELLKDGVEESKKIGK